LDSSALSRLLIAFAFEGGVSVRNLISGLGLILDKHRNSKRSRGRFGRKSGYARHLGTEMLERRAMLSTVAWSTNERDPGNSDGKLSLREAVSFAASGETITFDPSLDGATIALDRSLGQIEFSKSLRIDASALSHGITIDATGADLDTDMQGNGIRIFKITPATSESTPPEVTLVGLTLMGGDPSGVDDSAGDLGGAIFSQGQLTLENCNIHHNSASQGGGVYAQRLPAVTITRPSLTVQKYENSRQLCRIPWSGGSPLAGATWTFQFCRRARLPATMGIPHSAAPAAVFTLA
jgi:hypothetical protein